MSADALTLAGLLAEALAVALFVRKHGGAAASKG